jgi:signal transduction histidine kinase
VRSRLFLLVIIPTVTAVALGGLRVASSVQSAQVYQRVGQLAALSGTVTGLAQALQNEREDTVQYIVLGTDGRTDGLSSIKATAALAAPELAVLQKDYGVTSRWARQASGLLRGIGSSYPALAQQDASGALAAISGLPALRQVAAHSELPPLQVIQSYAADISSILAVDDQVAVGSNDSTLADSVRVASLMSKIKEEASQQQAILTSAQALDLSGSGQFGPSQQAAINEAQAEQQGNLADYNENATSAQKELYHNAVSGTAVVNAQQQEQQAISVATSGRASASDPTIANAGAAMTYLVASLRSAESQLVNSVIARSKQLRNNAITSVIIDSLAVLLVLALALIFTTIVGTSMVRPLRRLRAGALEVAGLRLPEAVRRMNESDGEGVSLDVEPINVDSTDEIGEVARAFDQVHREALRLASNEAALRGNVNAMFVNLSRRSQSLVERQIRLIDELEQGEQNSERLSSLFQMDHLATLMRRNSENLLVLAGHDVARRWNKPVALVDVLRAAVSEIEQYERVTLNVQPGISVRGQAVSDVVHLTAELVENATSFSPADTPVSIVGHLLSSGGVLLEIADQGVGMGAEEMAHANWRLDNPPVVDVAVSRRMGLFVVARLAARHSIRVRLRPASTGGLTALVWLPDEVVTHDTPGSSRLPDRLDSPAALQSSGNGSPAGPGGGTGNGMWVQPERSAAEQEVNAARAPRFAPLLADAADTGLGPRRIPGAGPRPGGDRAPATGPLPAFRTSPQPAPQSAPQRDAEAFVPAPQPVAEVATSGTASEQFGSASTPETGWGRQAGSSGAAGATRVSGSASVAASAQRRPTSGGPSGPPTTVKGLGGSSDSPRYGRTGRIVDSPEGGVIVPPPASVGEGNRLPIFEAVESDWFRHGRHGISKPGADERPASSAGSSDPDTSSLGTSGAGASGAGASGAGAGSADATSAEDTSWTSAADEGWRAAEAASVPTSGGVTPAGLPKRVPKANLVPGTAAEAPKPAPALTRSAAATRDRFASFQRGIREGRAAASGDEPADAERDDNSR